MLTVQTASNGIATALYHFYGTGHRSYRLLMAVARASQVLASLDDNMQRYGDMLSQQQRSTAVRFWLNRMPSRI